MLKSHSAGIGDLLASSAAWRVLKEAYPEVELHLLFLTREPGYPSEELICQHHLLSGFAAIDKRTKTRSDRRRYWSQIQAVGQTARPDLVIDFETNGVRTSMIAVRMAWRWRARTIGVNAFPGRNLFYSRSAARPSKYAARHGLALPMNYVERDFVALAALGLERNGCAIEMQETETGRKFRQEFRQKHGLDETVPLLGLNIGCGTPDAAAKRPDLGLLSELVAGMQRDHGMQLVLVGAPFERAVNQEFCAIHRQRSASPIIDLAGGTDMGALTGAINACRLFISSDSGPYHMAVGMRVPTLAIFRWNNSAHFHFHPWVRCCVVADSEPLPPLRQAAEELLAWANTSPRDHQPVCAPSPAR